MSGSPNTAACVKIWRCSHLSLISEMELKQSKNGRINLTLSHNTFFAPLRPEEIPPHNPTLPAAVLAERKRKGKLHSQWSKTLPRKGDPSRVLQIDPYLRRAGLFRRFLSVFVPWTPRVSPAAANVLLCCAAHCISGQRLLVFRTTESIFRSLGGVNCYSGGTIVYRAQDR